MEYRRWRQEWNQVWKHLCFTRGGFTQVLSSGISGSVQVKGFSHRSQLLSLLLMLEYSIQLQQRILFHLFLYFSVCPHFIYNFWLVIVIFVLHLLTLQRTMWSVQLHFRFVIFNKNIFCACLFLNPWCSLLFIHVKLNIFLSVPFLCSSLLSL